MGALDGLVGLFGREGDAIELVREDVPELFLRRNHRHLPTGLCRGSKDGSAAQVGWRVHHHLLSRFRVEKEISADPMNSRRRSGSDRGVVYVSEGGKGTAGHGPEGAFLEQPGQPGHPAEGEGGVEVFIRAPIDADNGYWPRGRAVGSVVDGKFVRGGRHRPSFLFAGSSVPTRMSRNTGLRIDIQGIYFQRETDGRGFQGTIKVRKTRSGSRSRGRLGEEPYRDEEPR